jgi:lysine 6-dehydrogenase
MSHQKKVLVFGAGLQGRALIHDLDRSPLIGEIMAADHDVASAREFAQKNDLKKVHFLSLDASSDSQVRGIVEESAPQMVASMLPPDFGHGVARAALAAGIPYVSSNYTGSLVELDREAREKGVTILPEMGMDPGIDLLLGQMAVAELDEVHGLYSYGAGIPEPACADNPLRYKITWTFDGVLIAYKRPGRMLRDGVEIVVPGTHMFRKEYMHLADFPGAGELEAYPNGDAIRYIDLFGLGKTVKTMGRFGMRYPGHCRFWQTMVDLGFLDDEPVAINGAAISPHQFLVQHLTPRLQFGPRERDIAIIRALAWGLKEGKELSVTYELTDYRDLKSGLFAMNRTVGYTVSIAAQMILSGAIIQPGVLSPARDVPAGKVLEELQARGMLVERRLESS